MAETEQITILKLKTEGAESVQDLRDNIKTLKKVIDETKIGTEEYQDALNLLRVNQNALKDAMYATSASMDDVKASATGASESYNSLVHRMSALKEEFRSTNDEVRRLELGKQIKSVNDQLKDLDALQGNFQRNVGNYTESIKDAFKGLAENTDAFGKSLNIAGGGINGFKDGFEAFGKSPAIATFGLLVTLAVKLADNLKENETAMEAVKSAMASLKPVMDFFSGIIEKLAGYLADIIGKVAEFVSSSGLFDKIVKGVTGVGNAILQYVIAPFKGVIEAIKVFKEQGVKGIGDAAKAFGQEIKSGFSFKQNFESGKVAAETMISGMASTKPQAKEEGDAIGKEIGKGVEEGLKSKLPDIDKVIAEVEKRDDESRKRRLEEQKEIDAEVDAEYQATLDDIEAYFAEQERLREQDLKDAEEKAKAKKATLMSVAAATSSILSSIADMYENDSEESEKNANKVKALRIASATIDTISGAIGAYMQSVATIPPPYGIITGIAQAAAVTAAGVAQIAQMKNTQVSANTGASAAVSVPAVISAPSVQTEVSNVRSITSASEEDRLNQMASNQRVYILASDIEASQNQIKTQVSESSF